MCIVLWLHHFLPFSHQVILPTGLNSWALALAAFFLEKCSQSSACCHLCKLWPCFSYQCMCSCCMPLVTHNAVLFTINLKSKFEMSFLTQNCWVNFHTILHNTLFSLYFCYFCFKFIVKACAGDQYWSSNPKFTYHLNH